MAIQIWDAQAGQYKSADLARFGGSGTLKEALVWDGTQYVKVWPSGPPLPVVQITGTTGNESRTQFRQACIDHGTTYDTVEVLPFRLDTSNATRLASMFNGCSSLTHVPDMDTANVTSMVYMFRNCSSLTHVPDMDTSNVTDMSYMFDGCLSLTHVPDMDTSNVTNMVRMFGNCAALTDGNVRLIGRHPDVSTTSMLFGSGLTREPFYDTNGNPI